MGQRTDRIFGAKPGIGMKCAWMLTEIMYRKSQSLGVWCVGQRR